MPGAAGAGTGEPGTASGIGEAHPWALETLWRLRVLWALTETACRAVAQQRSATASNAAKTAHCLLRSPDHLRGIQKALCDGARSARQTRGAKLPHYFHPG